MTSESHIDQKIHRQNAMWIAGALYIGYRGQMCPLCSSLRFIKMRGYYAQNTVF